MKAVKKLKKAVLDAMDGETVQTIRDQSAARIRTDPRIVARWMEYCGAEEPVGIDYGNPCVYIEWCAADISVLNLCDDAEAFIAETGCDREVFMKYYWPQSEGH